MALKMIHSVAIWSLRDGRTFYRHYENHIHRDLYWDRIEQYVTPFAAYKLAVRLDHYVPMEWDWSTPQQRAAVGMRCRRELSRQHHARRANGPTVRGTFG